MRCLLRRPQVTQAQVGLQVEADSAMVTQEPGGRVRHDCNLLFFLNFALWRIPNILQMINSGLPCFISIPTHFFPLISTGSKQIPDNITSILQHISLKGMVESKTLEPYARAHSLRIALEWSPALLWISCHAHRSGVRCLFSPSSGLAASYSQITKGFCLREWSDSCYPWTCRREFPFPPQSRAGAPEIFPADFQRLPFSFFKGQSCLIQLKQFLLFFKRCFIFLIIFLNQNKLVFLVNL